mgnify:CR=1 FL=1|tara:strand:- start:795 stop:1457 length:663 start_codon:yes stop_codon:yes gene_type:complete
METENISIYDLYKDIPTIIFDFDLQIPFMQTLFGGDQLGAVVRAHTEIESHLYSFVQAGLRKPDKLGETKLTFFQLVSLSEAYGCPVELIEPLRDLGRLRNDFCHGKIRRISADRESQMLTSYSPTFLAMTSRCAERYRKELQDEPKIDQETLDYICPSQNVGDISTFVPPYKWRWTTYMLRVHIMILYVLASDHGDDDLSFRVKSRRADYPVLWDFDVH